MISLAIAKEASNLSAVEAGARVADGGGIIVNALPM